MLTYPFAIPAIHDDIPESMEREAHALRQMDGKEPVLKTAYDLLSKRYTTFAVGTPLHIPTLLDHDIASLWLRRTRIYCTGMNYLLRIMLIKSGKFVPNDIQTKWTLLHLFSPHQYVRVRLADNAWIDVDIWAGKFGLSLGDHAHGFHTSGEQQPLGRS